MVQRWASCDCRGIQLTHMRQISLLVEIYNSKLKQTGPVSLMLTQTTHACFRTDASLYVYPLRHCMHVAVHVVGAGSRVVLF